MFIQLMIIIITLSDFLTLVYVKQRLEFNDTSLLAKKEGIELDVFKSRRMMALANAFRVFIAISILLFWIYGIFFIPFLKLPILLNIITSTISFITLVTIMKRNPNILNSFNKRVCLLRIDAVISLIIWFPYFLPLLMLAF